MNTIDNVQIRRWQSSDFAAIQRLQEIYEMSGSIDPDTCIVAEKSQELIGFANMGYKGKIPYLRQIVIAPESQHKGVGRRLGQNFMKDFPGLHVVARGYAKGFYQRLGFSPIEWQEIHPDMIEECQQCAELKSCMPVPMKSSK
jgi:N-acetylglutamate synthase-like GNAT family acetyltransferase